MMNQPFPNDEHKFDTLSLLAGLTEADTEGFSLEDILNEFGAKKSTGRPGLKPINPKPLSREEEEILKELEELPFLKADAKMPAPEPAAQAAAIPEPPVEAPVRKSVEEELEWKPVENRFAVKPEPTEPAREKETVVQEPASQEAVVTQPSELQEVPSVTESVVQKPVSAQESAAVETHPAEDGPSIIDQIQSAIDHDLELSMAAPEPVINLDKEDPGVGDPELDAIFREKENNMPPPAAVVLPPDRVPAGESQENAAPAPQRKTRKDGPNLRVVEAPEAVPSAAEVSKKAASGTHFARIRLAVVLVLTLAAVVLTAFNQFGWSKAVMFTSSKVLSKVLLGVMTVCAVFCADIIMEGVKNIFTLKCTGKSMMTLIFLVTAVDAVLCVDEQAIPFCAVVCLQFCFGAWGDLLKKLSIRRALRPILKLEKGPRGIALVEDAWENGDAAAVLETGSEDEHVRCLLRTDLSERRMHVYVPVAILLTLALAVMIRLKTGNSLTWSWSSMMIGALPLASFVSYFRPFSLLSARLMKSGAAVSGYAGAQRLAAADGIVLKDYDLFPEGSVKIHGMKVYGSYSVSQTVGYASAIMNASGCGLAPLFQELCLNNNGPQFTVAQFKRYESGGFGAEIGGDVVLVGSIRFMQLNGVYAEEKARVRNAIYLSVNGQMCALFVMNYAPAGKVRRSLRQILNVGSLSPLFATKDFLITPLMVEERFKLSNEGMVFPSVEEREALSKLPGDYPILQGALLGKGGFHSYVDAVIGAKLLCSVTGICSIINLVAGFLGILLMFLLAYLGAQSVVTAMNMLLFALVWALPSIILSGSATRY